MLMLRKAKQQGVHMNIIQVFKQFPTQESCIKHLEQSRWGDTLRCAYCGGDKVSRHSTKSRLIAYNVADVRSHLA